MAFRRIGWMLFIGLLVLLNLPAAAQDTGDLVQLTVEAGYDQYFRPDYWLPVRINVRNDGDSITGRLTVRPETSGRVVSNAYSTPIDLPTGSEKTAFLYIQASHCASFLSLAASCDRRDPVSKAPSTRTLHYSDPRNKSAISTRRSRPERRAG